MGIAIALMGIAIAKEYEPMTTIVVATMTLYVNSQDAAVLKELDKRFPRELQDRWSRMTFASNANLHANLNAVLLADALPKIQEYDYANATTVTAFAPFGAPTTWQVGSSGQHEANRPIAVGENIQPGTWRFSVNGNAHDVKASVIWTDVTVPA